MSVHDDIKLDQIRSAARTIGATLPASVAAAIEHHEELRAEQAPSLGDLAAEVAEHIGHRHAFDKARKAALTVITQAAAGKDFRAALLDRTGATAWDITLRHREDVAAAFGDALAADVATLRDYAGRLPRCFDPEDPVELTAEQVDAYRRCSTALARIQSTDQAMHHLYPSLADHGPAFTPRVAASLRFVDVPALGCRAAGDLLLSLDGRVRTGDTTGAARSIEVFLPAPLAHAGVVFAWATPSEVKARAERLVQAASRPDRG